ncbi:MAG TPA: hypothetical protein ENI92_10005 [Bacteroidetes bacterium]|nr:hypothetical protein [Bacteroidota bacterium]
MDTLAVDTSAAETAVPPGFRLEHLLRIGERREGYETVFFRKQFTSENRITFSEVYITADDDYTLYVNGEYIAEDEHEDSTDWSQVDTWEITEFVHRGENLIAVELNDPDRTSGGLWVRIVYNTIPEVSEDMPVVLPGEEGSTEVGQQEQQGTFEQPIEELQETPTYPTEPDTTGGGGG